MFGRRTTLWQLPMPPLLVRLSSLDRCAACVLARWFLFVPVVFLWRVLRAFLEHTPRRRLRLIIARSQLVSRADESQCMYK